MEIESVPQFGEDIFRAVNRLPGLSSSDYSAHFSIRGGRSDETLILLDGLEIYEPYHLKDYSDGAISIVDAETIGGVELMTGGFPAQYGNRTSGVFSIRSRDPVPEQSRYSVGLSLVNARGMAEGTFGGGKGSWFLSARRGYLDLILDLLKQIDLPSPSYYDVFGKASYRLAPGHELSVDVLHARDKYTFDAPSTTGVNDSIQTRELANNRYGNSYVWGNLRSFLGDRAEVNTMVSAGWVTTSRDGTEYYQADGQPIYALENTRDFNVLGFKQDWRWDWSRFLALRAGVDLRRFDAKYAFTNLVNQNPDDPTPDTTGFYPQQTELELKRQGTTLGSYVSARIAPVDVLTVEAGLRYDRSSYTRDRDLSPRFNAMLSLSDATRLRAGWGYFRQMQPIASLEAFQGPETYFPSELSEQITVGLEQDLGRGGVLRVEGYLKRGSDLRPVFRTWKGGLDVFPETGEDWILVHPDSSRSRGIEVY
ncbi:MAG TPA: TonB-dependent receptor, partial [Acidobacteriota bacterium]|nr:TonB-dependent receptor [Acidobacteriota bacterium]